MRSPRFQGFWSSLSDLVALTLVAYQPTLAFHYRRHFPWYGAGSGGDGNDSERCFHILGFDVLLGGDGLPHLLEVRRALAKRRPCQMPPLAKCPPLGLSAHRVAVPRDLSPGRRGTGVS